MEVYHSRDIEERKEDHAKLSSRTIHEQIKELVLFVCFWWFLGCWTLHIITLHL